MAGSDSVAFNPPVNTVKDKDPMVVKVDMTETEFGFRKSQAPAMQTENMTIRHVSNGG